MGGNAFKDNPTRRILREEIPGTLSWLAEWLPFSQDHMRSNLLGSAGKRPTSGDLDIAVSGQVDLDSLTQRLISVLGEDRVQSRPGNRQIFTAVPIEGSVENGHVQVDWMFGDIEWLHFSYFSPGDTESAYKGLYRTELIKAMVTSRSLDYQFEKNELVGRVGPTFFHDRGVEWRCRLKPMRKDGQRRRKDFVIVTKQEYEKHFGVNVPMIPGNIIRPDDVVQLILGQYRDPSQLYSYESTWNLCKECGLDLPLVSQLYLERLNSLGVDIPEEIEKEHKGLMAV